MVSGFEPLFDRLVYIRYMSLVRPAVPVAVDPIKCWVAFYFALDKENTIVYSTDQKPDYRPNLTGNLDTTVLDSILMSTIDFDCAYFQWHEVPKSFNLGDDPNSCIRVDTELRPNGPNHADVPPVPNVPWGSSKLLLGFDVEQF